MLKSESIVMIWHLSVDLKGLLRRIERPIEKEVVETFPCIHTFSIKIKISELMFHWQ